MNNRFGGSAHDLAEELGISGGRWFAIVGPQLGVVLPNREVGERAEFVQLTKRRRKLEVPEPDEARGHPTNNRSGFKGCVSVIEHVAHHLVAGETKR